MSRPSRSRIPSDRNSIVTAGSDQNGTSPSGNMSNTPAITSASPCTIFPATVRVRKSHRGRHHPLETSDETGTLVECVPDGRSRHRPVQNPARKPRHAVERHADADQDDRQPEHCADARYRHGKKKGEGQEDAHEQHPLLAERAPADRRNHTLPAGSEPDTPSNVVDSLLAASWNSTLATS